MQEHSKIIGYGKFGGKQSKLIVRDWKIENGWFYTNTTLFTVA